MIGSDGWSITDGGYDCTVTTPVTPTIAPDMTSTTDSGISSGDNITNDATPDFVTSCVATGNLITLYVDTIANATGSCMGTAATITA